MDVDERIVRVRTMRAGKEVLITYKTQSSPTHFRVMLCGDNALHGQCAHNGINVQIHAGKKLSAYSFDEHGLQQRIFGQIYKIILVYDKRETPYTSNGGAVRDLEPQVLMGINDVPYKNDATYVAFRAFNNNILHLFGGWLKKHEITFAQNIEVRNWDEKMIDNFGIHQSQRALRAREEGDNRYTVNP